MAVEPKNYLPLVRTSSDNTEAFPLLYVLPPQVPLPMANVPSQNLMDVSRNIERQ